VTYLRRPINPSPYWQRFRRLNAPELMKEVHDGAKYVNGVRVQERPWEDAA